MHILQKKRGFKWEINFHLYNGNSYEFLVCYAIKSVLSEEDKKTLLKYSDACWGRQGYSEQRLAEQVYEDLRK